MSGDSLTFYLFVTTYQIDNRVLLYVVLDMVKARSVISARRSNIYNSYYYREKVCVSFCASDQRLT